MGNVLMSYFNNRLNKGNPSEKSKPFQSRPVVTISREVGCGGMKLAKKLACRLNDPRFFDDWQVLSKEIFRKSANELQIDTVHLKRVFTESDKYTLEEIIKAFNNKNFKSERRIVNTVKDVVRTSAIEGFVIIVGRAAHIVSADLKNAFHIRLTAPLEYRIKAIQKKKSLEREQAIEYINRVEQERIAFRKAFDKNNLHEENFDIILNCSSYSDEGIVDIVETAIDKKGILNDTKPKVQYY